MVINCPRKWVRWLPHAQYWYNTNLHTSLQRTPCETLFGYVPGMVDIGSIPSSHVEAVNLLLKERLSALQVIKDHLEKAQARTKHYADKKKNWKGVRSGRCSVP